MGFLFFFCVSLVNLVECLTGAIIVSGSRYWHNYRHSSNALVFYHALRRLGLRDSSISLFLSGDSHACDSRNVHRGDIYNSETPSEESSSSDEGGLLPGGGRSSAPVEVDFSGTASNAESLLRVLTGRIEPGSASGGGVADMSSSMSLLLVLTGHGGDGYLKFHDKDELGYADLAWALREAHALGRYGRLLVIVDTCQADSLGIALKDGGVPNALVVASSLVGQNSYAVGMDYSLSVSLADSFSRIAGLIINREGKFKEPWSGGIASGWRGEAVTMVGGDSNLGSLCAAEIAASKKVGNGPEDTSLYRKNRTAACKFLMDWSSPSRLLASLGWVGAVDSLHAEAAARVGVQVGSEMSVMGLVESAQRSIVGDSTVSFTSTGGAVSLNDRLFSFFYHTTVH